MRKRLTYFLLFLIIGGCIEPYEFVIHDAAPLLVVEAFISDKSYSDTRLYPSDGRYFTVRLSSSGDVTNTQSRPVHDAEVEVISRNGKVWHYTPGKGGVYTLFDNDFRAQRGMGYKLRILLPDESIYESSWETMPGADIPSIGAVSFFETEKQMYIMEANEWVLRTKKSISASISVPENRTGETIFYRWTYWPTWIYEAPLTNVTDPVYRCWVTDANYLNTFGLQADRTGGYHQDLFDMLTIRNDRIFVKFSVLVTQQAMTEQYFNFWKEMKEQNEGSNLTDKPPFNLQTNFSSISGNGKALGYFAVTSEQATRQYFERKSLSYNVENTLKADCLVDYGGPPAEACSDCTFYPFGKAVTEKPVWWED